MRYAYITWKESGIWTAHAPAVPGVYGLGRTRVAAVRDLVDALEHLLEYLDEIGERPPRPQAVRVGQVDV